MVSAFLYSSMISVDRQVDTTTQPLFSLKGHTSGLQTYSHYQDDEWVLGIAMVYDMQPWIGLE